MYEKGARVKEIAAYIGDLESTTERYYSIAVRKRVKEGNGIHQVIMVPGADKGIKSFLWNACFQYII